MVSDIHLGNPLYRSREPFVVVLRYAYAHDFAVCVNGDGVDIAQSSLARLARDLAGCNREFARFARRGLPITVMFEGSHTPGSYRTSVRIVAGQGAEVTVPVIVAVSASGPDK